MQNRIGEHSELSEILPAVSRIGGEHHDMALSYWLFDHCRPAARFRHAARQTAHSRQRLTRWPRYPIERSATERGI